MKFHCKIELQNGENTQEVISAKTKDQALGVIEMKHPTFSSCEVYEVVGQEFKFLGKAVAKKEIEEDQVLTKIDEVNQNLVAIKWACRSVAIGLLVIIFFGIKLTIE